MIKNEMNFKEHITFGIVIGIILSIIFLLYEGLSLMFAFPLFLAIIGSVLPDIDHHASIPFRGLKIFVFILGFLGIFIFLTEHSEFLNPIIEKISEILPVSDNVISVFIIFTASLVAGILLVKILKILKPPHRGITHKKKFGFFIAFLLFLFFYFKFSLNFSALCALSFLAGFLSHLALDKILF